MAQKVLFVCDRCKQDIEPGKVIIVDLVTDSFMDGAGSRDYSTERVDLCPSCVCTSFMTLINCLFGGKKYSANQNLIQYLRSPKAVNLNAAIAGIELPK